MAAQLTLQDVSLQFGGIKVLQDVSFAVEPGQIFGLVGPNGAGKTSLFNCISGHYKPTAGTVRIDDTEVQGARPATLARHGLARTFQHPALQLHETVLENVLLGAHTRLPGGPLEWSLRLPAHPARGEGAARRGARPARAQRPRLGRAPAGRRAVARPPQGRRALPRAAHEADGCCSSTSRPPASRTPRWSTLIATVRRLRTDDDITVVIVEHHMGLIAALTDRVVVLDHGAQAHGGDGRRGAVRPPGHRGVHREGRRG